jgi:hypothetical protein
VLRYDQLKLQRCRSIDPVKQPQARNVMANWPQPWQPGLPCIRLLLLIRVEQLSYAFRNDLCILSMHRNVLQSRFDKLLCGKSSQGAHATGSAQPADSFVEDKSVAGSHAGGLKMHLSQPMMLCAKV